MQRKQFLVKLSNESEGNQFIQFLESEGFENIHKITFDRLRIKVLVVDGTAFFATNITCLAALAGSNIKPIGVDDFMKIYKSKLTTNNAL